MLAFRPHLRLGSILRFVVGAQRSIASTFLVGEVFGTRRVFCNDRALACAVIRRRFPVGESPTRQPLQPEATGATVEVTKWLKPPVKGVTTYGDSASVQALT